MIKIKVFLSVKNHANKEKKNTHIRKTSRITGDNKSAKVQEGSSSSKTVNMTEEVDGK